MPDITVWVMPKTRTVLITDDPGVPVSACIIGDEPRENAGWYKHFEPGQDPWHYASQEADRLGYKLAESWRWL